MRRLRLFVLGLIAGCQFPNFTVPAADDHAPSNDACEADPCLNDGRCIPYEGTFVCLCADGFRGDTCQVDVDDCDPNPCQNAGVCVDGTDTSYCDCAAGWEGATCSQNIDDCAASPCLNGGTCTDGVNGFVCNCPSGFQGDSCEVAFSSCDPNPCQNAGTCQSEGEIAFCSCPSGWDGATCQHNIDDCSPNPCQNFGTCTDDVAGHSCRCAKGFTGDDCDDTSFETCAAIHEALPNLGDGIYLVDPDGAGTGNPPFEVMCDMTFVDGGWTLAGQEREGVGGTFKFLGAVVGDLTTAARQGKDALFGPRFAGKYSEVRVDWSNHQGASEGLYFQITEEMFANTVSTAMPIRSFWTTDSKLLGWITDASGAVLCRASQVPTVRPGDSSWAIKPLNSAVGNCGCNGSGWTGRGAFYGGHTDATSCVGMGGGWAGVADDGEPKGALVKFATKIWIR